VKVLLPTGANLAGFVLRQPEVSGTATLDEIVGASTGVSSEDEAGVWYELLEWLGSLGEQYGVDPVVYAILYVGAAPFFFGSLAWLIRRLRRRQNATVPAVSAAFFFSLPTLYVFVAGRDLPPWIYLILVGLAVVGAIAAVRRVRNAVRRTS
jgi:hypothetical protein